MKQFIKTLVIFYLVFIYAQFTFAQDSTLVTAANYTLFPGNITGTTITSIDKTSEQVRGLFYGAMRYNDTYTAVSGGFRGFLNQ